MKEEEGQEIEWSLQVLKHKSPVRCLEQAAGGLGVRCAMVPAVSPSAW